MTRITVVGGGVAGLTTALELALAGHDVRCVRDLPVLETVSRIAGGLWLPFRAAPRERVLAWALAGFDRYVELAEDPSAGVRLLPGTIVHRQPPEHWWTGGRIPVHEADPSSLPAGALSGSDVTVPVIDSSAFLLWLENECRATGVEFVEATVLGLDEVTDEVVVVAAGIRSGEVVGPDRGLTPVRGQIAYLDNPGIDSWYLDADDVGRLTYVLPQGRYVVCGGTYVEGEWSTEPLPEVEEGILERCRDAVPRLRDQPVVGRAVGLRPAAPHVRLQARRIGDRLVVTNYGHGGSGLTVAWGCAAEIVQLIAAEDN